MKLGEKIITVEPPNVEKDDVVVLRNITMFNKMQKVYNKLTSERVCIIEKEILAREILEIMDDDFRCNIGINAFNILGAGLLDDWDFPEFN